MPVGRYVGFPLLLLAAMVQSTVLSSVTVRGGHPDLVLSLVMAWALLAGAEEGVIWALMAGVFEDLLTGVPLGVSALALTGVTFPIAWLTGRIGRNNLLVPPPAVVCATLGYHLILIVLYSFLGGSLSIVDSLLNVTLPSALMNALLILPLFRLLGAFYELIRPRTVSM